MKTITSIKKNKKSVSVTIDNKEINIEPELMIKYRLTAGSELTDERYFELINENNYLSCLRLSLTKLKKMMTIFEMKSFLSEQDFPLGIQKQVLHYLIERNYLDDIFYSKTYLELKKYQEGPHMISFKLKQKGVSEVIIEALWHHYNEREILMELLTSKLRQMQKKTKKQAFQILKTQMMTKGFHQEVIDEVLGKLTYSYEIDEEVLIEKNFQKIMKTYGKKYSGQELQYKIKEKLYQKGFSYDMIKAYLEKNKL